MWTKLATGLNRYPANCSEEAKKLGLSRPLKLHHHPTEQTHTNWVSTESSFEVLPSLNLKIAPLCHQL